MFPHSYFFLFSRSTLCLDWRRTPSTSCPCECSTLRGTGQRRSSSSWRTKEVRLFLVMLGQVAQVTDDSWSQLYFCLHFSCNSVLRVSWRDMVFAAGEKKDTLNKNQCVSKNCQKSRLLNHTSDAFAFLPKKAPLFIHVYQKRRYKMPFPLPPDLHWETKVCVPFCAQKALLFPLGIQRARIALAPFFRYTTTTELLQCRLLFSREKKREKESIPIQGGGGGGKGKKAINRRERRGKVEQGSFFTGKSG